MALTGQKLRARDASLRLVLIGLFWGNLIFITGFWFANVHHVTLLGAMVSAVGGWAGLVAAFLVLMQVMMMARIDFVESSFGRDTITRYHRLNGYAIFYLLLAHLVFTTSGYAISGHINVIDQLLDFIQNYSDVFKSLLGFGLFIGVIVSSVMIVRRRMRYEYWYAVHLLTYLAIILAFSHQLAVGSDFIGHPLFVDYWYLLYALTVSFLITYRFALPVYQSWRHKFVVHSVVRETPDTVSIYVTGRNLNRFRFRAGQFASWYFLTPGLWWQGHPFSFSESHNGKFLRLTVKALGDYTTKLVDVQPGTRILLDGPTGRFISDLRRRQKVLLIGGGVGITPLRSMLRELAAAKADVVLLYAVRTPEDISFAAELTKFSGHRHVRVEYIYSGDAINPRYIDAQVIAEYVSDANEREIFVCGPVPMMDLVTSVMKDRGVEPRYINSERFSF